MTGINFSIIICTYNPDPKIFQRLLDAVFEFDDLSAKHEVIIVDNNSAPVLQQNKNVEFFLTNKKDSKLIIEKNPGLTAARIAGIREAKFDWLIFFDDDNDPASDYLHGAKQTIEMYPGVGAWGPGIISVIYTDLPVSKWLDNFKNHFQEKTSPGTRFSKEKWWQSCYPPGTGLIIRKDIAIEYSKRISKGVYSLNDRTGRSLSSGGDVQMVLTGIEMDYAAGTSECLKMTHLINKRKANLHYLMKHAAGTAASNLPAHFEVFPFDKSNLKMPKVADQFKQVYYYAKVISFRKGWRYALLNLSAYWGELDGIRFLLPDARKSWLHKLFFRLFSLN